MELNAWCWMRAGRDRSNGDAWDALTMTRLVSHEREPRR